MQKNDVGLGNVKMYNELNINVLNENHRAFFMNGFLSSSGKTATNLHKHNFPEIHFVTGGSALFLVGKSKTTLESGSIMIIPQGEFHCCLEKEDTTLHNAFQIDFSVTQFKKAHIGSETVLGFFREIENLKITGNFTKTAAYIVLFCSYLCDENKMCTSSVSDYGFIIQEFISMNYNKSIRLSDLASTLHLSERQAERLVRHYTGNSFKEEVCKTRIKVANMLMQSSDMPLTKIAEYVGYKSYAGFWKAMGGGR